MLPPLPYIAIFMYMSNITKNDLVLDISTTLSMPKKDVKKVVDAFIVTLVHNIAEGNPIELRGFGTFSVQHRKGRPVRNPRTSEALHLDSRDVPVLKFCDVVKDAVFANYLKKLT